MSAADWIEPSMEGVAWTLTNREQVASRPSLSEDAECDICVVGAGYLGLTTALKAAENGASVILLETGRVGAGASGRNGGFAVPHFPGALRPSDVEKRLGPRKGPKLLNLVADGPNNIRTLVQRHGIQSDFEQNGWVNLAHSKAALTKVRAVYDDWKAFGAPGDWLDADGVNAELGSPTYLGGWRSPTGAVLNPYAHALGLARAAEAAGVRIFENSRVTGIEQEDRGPALVRVVGAKEPHVVRAGKVLVATNAYTDPLVPALQKTAISVRLYHCATSPLPEEVLSKILPNKNCFGDLRKSGGFARLDVAGRLIQGGAVFSAHPASRSYGLAHSRRRILEFFPQLAGVKLEFQNYWEGYCAITDSFLPHVQRLRPDVFSVLGFATRGVSLSQNVGLVMGDFLTGRITLDDVPLEVTDGVRKISMHGLKTAVGRQVFPFYRLKDRLGLT